VKIFNRVFLVLLLGALLVAPRFAQSGRARGEGADNAETRSAQALFEEANTYLDKKFKEFDQKKVTYDPKLVVVIEEQQRDLSVKYAAVLQTRSPLAGDDYYYLGMLHHLSTNGDGALDSMRKFLSGNPAGEKAQLARAVIVLYTVKKDLIPEAEAMATAYGENQPQDPKERYGIEHLLTDAYLRAKNYERMSLHAKRMFAAAKVVVTTRKLDVFKRDEMLLKSATFLAEAFVRLNQPQRAGGAFQELRKFAVSLPSGNLYKMANMRLATVDPNADFGSIFDEAANSEGRTPPEIVGSKWIDQQPITLEELHGQVVLLDFWAPWCDPCRFTFPKLQKWHDSYKDKGLVILGVTNYYGEADGKSLTHEEELDYLRNFKRKNRLPYGFVVADSSVNDMNYGVFSIPMSFLIDRQGNVRFIATGAGELEIARLGKMIKKLLDESASGPTAAGAGAKK